MTNTKQIMLLTSLALALSITQSHAQQPMMATGNFGPGTAAWQAAMQRQAPSTTSVDLTTAAPALTPAQPETSQNITIIQNLDQSSDTLGRTKGLYTLMQQAVEQQFETTDQSAFAAALVHAFNDARTIKTYMQQLLQAATQTSLLNPEQQKYVNDVMQPMYPEAAAQATAVPAPATTVVTPAPTVTPAPATVTPAPTATNATIAPAAASAPAVASATKTTPAKTTKAAPKKAAKKTIKKVVKKAVPKALKPAAKVLTAPVAATPAPTTAATPPITTTPPSATTTI